MTAHNLRTIVKNASAASLLSPVEVKGVNSYVFGTNLISWDEANNYTLERVSKDFGQPVVSNGPGSAMFRCGDSEISAYDFGLVFSCFAAIVAAHTETGTTIFTSYADTSALELDVVWFGNHAIVYSRERNLILPITSACVQGACRYQKTDLSNFTDVRSYRLIRERLSFVIENSMNEVVCRFSIPAHVQRAFPNLFDDDPANDEIMDDPNTPWDERSALGSLIASSTSLTSAEETVERYKSHVSLESVVNRTDLVFTPKIRYNSVQEFLGSLCYSDKGRIALAVNFRDNLFVYKPWFSPNNPDGIQVDSAPNFGAFYNVTQECIYIERYAKSVVKVPLTAAQFDIEVFEKIKAAFYAMELPRLSLASVFGRIVIPESVLVKGLSTASGETMYCLVMVGVIGNNAICKDENGNLYAAVNPPWLKDQAFFDITEVI